MAHRVPGAPLVYSSGALLTWCAISINPIYSPFPSSVKQKFIMMPVLIQGPKQPGNDNDVYLRPLVEELLQLWNGTGVRAWDEHMGEEFDLKALLFVTINDWPALSNLSGQTNKGYHACTHCLDDIDSIYWSVVGRMCTWDIVDFFRAGIP